MATTITVNTRRQILLMGMSSVGLTTAGCVRNTSETKPSDRDADTVAMPDREWSTTVDGKSGIAVDDACVYVAEHDQLRALDARTGTDEWTTEVVARHRMPAVSDGTAFVVSDEDPAVLHALNATDGDSVWTTAFDSDVEHVRLAPTTERLYAAADDTLLAFSPDDGELLWRERFEHQVRAPAPGGDAVYATAGPTGSHGKDGTVRAVSADDGAGLWEESVDGATTPPLVADGAVYVGDKDGTVRRLDGDSGEPDWTCALDGRVHGSLALRDGVVFASDSGPAVVAVDTASGDRLWRHELENLGGPASLRVTAGLTVREDEVYAATPYLVHAIDADAGVERWRFEGETGQGGNWLRRDPIPQNGLLYVVSPARIDALDLDAAATDE